MIKAKINNIEVEVPEGTTILAAAELAQVKISTLCYHPDLPPTAACGICVVKIKGHPNMVRACCMPISEGMEIITQDPEIISVRRTVLELILATHPNSCLTCGRNGQCELQTLAAEFGIRESIFTPLVPEIPQDDSTGTIVLDATKCVRCGRCITVCQQGQDVWALCMMNRGLETHISAAGDIALAESPCVRCGQCSAHCPTGAIFEFDQTAEVWNALMDPEIHCIAQIAPAVRVSVGENLGYAPGTILTGKLYAALRRMGFETVFDTNFGADVTIMEEASEFVERFQGKNSLPLITTCCPSWVDFMEKFHPDMIEHFSSCKSPQSIVGALAKNYYAKKIGVSPDKIYVVSIMPCTSKKYEIKRAKEMYSSGFQDVDISLTTRELTRMLQQSGIEFDKLPEEEADSPLGSYSGAGTIFGGTGGVMEAALRTAYHLITGGEMDQLEHSVIHSLEGVKELRLDINGTEVRVAVAHGLRNVSDLMEKIRTAKENGEEPPYHFVEVMACKGGCVGGGGQTWGVTDAKRIARAKALSQDDRNSTIRRSHQNPDVITLYRDYVGSPLSEKAHQIFHTKYKARKLYKR